MYKTDKEFREAIEERMDIVFSAKAWDSVKEVLFMAAIHNGYTESDVEDAVYILEKLKVINEGENESKST